MSRPSQAGLLLQRRFGPLWAAHGFNALLNHLLRAGALVVISAGGEAVLGSAGMRAAAAVVFVLPALLLAPLGGQLADALPRHRMLLAGQACTVAGGLCAAAGLLVGSTGAVLAGVGLGGAGVALFGPVLGSLLRHYLEDGELTAGAGLVVAGRMAASLLALGLGYLALSAGLPWPALLAGALLATGGLGMLASLAVPATRPARPGLGPRLAPGPALARTLGPVLRDRNLFLAVLGISWFWFTSLVYLVYLPDYAAAAFGASRDTTTLLLASAMAGLGAGALACHPASGRRVELGLVPLGALGMAAAGIGLYLLHPERGGGVDLALIALLLALLGAAAALFVVPLQALVLQITEPRRLGRVLGGMYFYNLLFVTLALAGAGWLRAEGLSPQGLMLITSLLHALVCVYIFLLLPEFLLRVLMWFLVNGVYRVEARGLSRIPVEGPVVLACNHVSYVDALVIGAHVRRPVRFVMARAYFDVPVLRQVFRLAKVIPIAPGRSDPGALGAAMDQVAAELEAGHVVGIFPEGRLTPDGEVQPFRRGIERIVARTPAPVVPMALQGLWGSWFSDAGGGRLRGLPRPGLRRVGLVVGEPVPARDVTAEDLRERVLTLRGSVR